MPIRLVLALAASACALVISAAPAATAKKLPVVELRVEGPNGTLDPGTFYATGSEKVRKSRPGDACVRDQGRLRFPGSTALGLPQTASEHRKALRQVRVRLDEAGPFVCEIGGIVGRPFTDPDGFAGWSYWLNGEFGSQSADLVNVRRRHEVVWVFSDFNVDPNQQVNTGSLLELHRVPARSSGEFVVGVTAHSFDGTASPAEGATIHGASSVSELGDGQYEVTVPSGITTLTATRGTDIPSNHMKTCNRADEDECPRAHGKRIFGSDRGDRLVGGLGWDRIRTLGGKDLIDLRKGGRDKVNCGGGRDKVKVKRRDPDDRIARNCEVVKG
jgi:hypothetical protein